MIHGGVEGRENWGRLLDASGSVGGLWVGSFSICGQQYGSTSLYQQIVMAPRFTGSRRRKQLLKALEEDQEK